MASSTGEILEVLKEIGYRGIMSVELFNPTIWESDPEEVIKTARQKCELIINKYWRCD